jgi:hypothetical protein
MVEPLTRSVRRPEAAVLSTIGAPEPASPTTPSQAEAVWRAVSAQKAPR